MDGRDRCRGWDGCCAALHRHGSSGTPTPISGSSHTILRIRLLPPLGPAKLRLAPDPRDRRGGGECAPNAPTGEWWACSAASCGLGGRATCSCRLFAARKRGDWGRGLGFSMSSLLPRILPCKPSQDMYCLRQSTSPGTATDSWCGWRGAGPTGQSLIIRIAHPQLRCWQPIYGYHSSPLPNKMEAMWRGPARCWVMWGQCSSPGAEMACLHARLSVSG